MRKHYLKVRLFDCPKCKVKDVWEVVVSGVMTHRRKEQPYSENIIGYDCSNCGWQKKVEVKNNLMELWKR